MTGMLIVVDGLDGTGKTGAIARLSKWFEQSNVEHIVTREPGGTQLAQHIRMGLRHGFEGVTEEMDPVAEMLLFNVARADHVAKIIRPALAAGKVVLCDRYFDTTLAYQGGGRGLDLKMMEDIHHLAIGLYPDVTFLMDGPPEVFLKRMEDETRDEVNKFDSLGLPFYERAREVYLNKARVNPSGYVLINADCSPDQVFAQFLPELNSVYHKLNPRPTY